jgi:hypothetical protein
MCCANAAWPLLASDRDQEAESRLRRNNHTQDVVGAVRIAEQPEPTTLLGWGPESIRVRRCRQESPAIRRVANVGQWPWGHPRRTSGVSSAELIDLASVAFGGAASTAVALQRADVEAFDGWAVIDETLGGAWCADPFVDQLNDFDDALALGDSSFDTVANFHGVGGLG